MIAVYIILSTAVLTGFLFPLGELGRLLKLTGNYWLGVMLYPLPVIGAADAIRRILRRFGRLSGSEEAGRKRLAVTGALFVLQRRLFCV